MSKTFTTALLGFPRNVFHERFKSKLPLSCIVYPNLRKAINKKTSAIIYFPMTYQQWKPMQTPLNIHNFRVLRWCSILNLQVTENLKGYHQRGLINLKFCASTKHDLFHNLIEA